MTKQDILNKIEELEALVVKVQDAEFGTQDGYNQLQALYRDLGKLEDLLNN